LCAELFIKSLSFSSDFQGKWQKPRRLTSDQNGECCCWSINVWSSIV